MYLHRLISLTWFHPPGPILNINYSPLHSPPSTISSQIFVGSAFLRSRGFPVSEATVGMAWKFCAPAHPQESEKPEGSAGCAEERTEASSACTAL